MNECLITNWNALVQPNDLVYHMGDFAFGNVQEILKQLKGQIHFITGSHDKNTQCCKHLFASYSPLKEIKIDEQPITLCHYSMRTWAKSHYGAWMLYGHAHGGLASWGKSFDAGVDTNNFFPYSWEQVKAKMATLPDNFNLVKEKRYG